MICVSQAHKSHHNDGKNLTLSATIFFVTCAQYTTLPALLDPPTVWWAAVVHSLISLFMEVFFSVVDSASSVRRGQSFTGRIVVGLVRYMWLHMMAYCVHHVQMEIIILQGFCSVKLFGYCIDDMYLILSKTLLERSHMGRSNLKWLREKTITIRTKCTGKRIIKYKRN